MKSSVSIKHIIETTGDNSTAIYRLLRSPKRRTKEFYIRKLTDHVRDEVKKIYSDEEVSYTLPDVRFSNYRFMSMTLKEAYEVYLRKCQTQRKVAESTFCAMKPKTIHTVQETPLRGCKCEYCQNFGLLRETLIGLGFKGIPKNHAASIEVTWCKFRKNEPDLNESESDEEENMVDRDVDLPRKECVERQCKKCGITNFEKKLIQDNRDLIRKLKNVKWKQWKKVEYKAPDSNKINKKWDIVSFYGSSSRLLSIYMKQLQSMSRHQFMKIWQLRNFNSAKANLQPGQVLWVHDFSQNILLYYQDEVGGKHWDHEQITVHPTSMLMKCLTCDGIVHEELIHITPDKHHDHKAVHQFVQESLHHLERKGIEIREIIEFTDHASSQYKSKYSFFNLSNMEIPITRHYFGVKHGKGPSDSAGAHFKKFVKQTILKGKNLYSCAEVGEYSVTKYVKQDVTHGNKKRIRDVYAHSLKASFFYPEILLCDEEAPKLRTLTGCRDTMHAVRNTGFPGVVEWRDFDCCCHGCFTHTGYCSNTDLADKWKRFSLTTNYKPKQLKELDLSNWMPSYTKTKERDVEGNGSSIDDAEVLSSDESVCKVLDSDDSDSSTDDYARSLSPEEIIISSDDDADEAEEQTSKTAQPVDSDVPISSDEMEYLDSTSSSSDEDSDEPINYKRKLKKYNSYRHYTRLKGHIMKKSLPAPITSIKDRFTAADTVDPTAKHFYPPDGPVGYFPIVTGSDGNCLPRALSHLMFGTEDQHLEVRCRIIEAGVKFEDDFTSHDMITRSVMNGSKNRPCMYATNSPQLLQRHQTLNRDEIRDVYQKEIMGITKNSEYMGIWQLHQAAEAFRRPIGSVFPHPSNLNLREDMNRIILPLNPTFDIRQPVHVQWTPLHKATYAADVKHFVCLMKPPTTVSIVII